MAPVGMQRWEEPPAGSFRDSACVLLLDSMVNWLKLDQLPNGGCLVNCLLGGMGWGSPGPPSLEALPKQRSISRVRVWGPWTQHLSDLAWW
jgi:hypothetical protein